MSYTSYNDLSCNFVQEGHPALAAHHLGRVRVVRETLEHVKVADLTIMAHLKLD